MATETMPRRIWAVILQSSDMQAPLLLVAVIGMLIIPMPGIALDLLLVANIGLTLLILLRTTSVSQPLEFSVFPSLLLVTTLFRLALNISATRLILGSKTSDGAGQIIEAFGTYVVGSNQVVGFVIFVILVVIQFVVITAGAGRVAEVGARFTLDAMPGKQMAIDADLNAGMIDEQAAKKRRSDVSREADFYGAMDGASKFVRGDAIAAIIMMVINIVGGFAVGMLMHGMPWNEALNQYTTKTVGEGIVTQIPALIMSIATGLVVTRSTSDSNLGNDLSTQIFDNWRILAICAIIISAFVLVPGLPPIPFLMGGVLLGGLAYVKAKQQTRMAAPVADTTGRGATSPTSSEEIIDLLTIDPMVVEIGYGMVQLADPAQGGNMLERITGLRRQIALDMGFVVPPVRVCDNIQLRSNGYVIKLWGVEVGQGEILPRYHLAMNPGNDQRPLSGAIPTTEPAFGLPAMWVPEQQKLEAEMAGYTVVDPTTVLITHLSEIIKTHAHEVLTRQDAQALVDKVRASSPALVDELVPKVMSLSEVHRILQNLLRERVPIRDLNRILSVMGDYIGTTRDLDQLTEYVRQALARAISRYHQGTDGAIDVFTLDPALEEMMLDHLRPTQFNTQVVLDPLLAQQLLTSVKAHAERAIAMGNQPIVLCSSQIRPYFRRLVERYLPGITVLSHAEIAPGVQVRSSGTVVVS